MAKYEVVLVKYPYPDDGWWTAICPAVQGCVSDGQTRAEALQMIADAMALLMEPEPGCEVAVRDAEQTRREKEVTLAECHQDGGTTEVHWVEPRFMTEEEIRNNPHLDPEPTEFPIV